MSMVFFEKQVDSAAIEEGFSLVRFIDRERVVGNSLQSLLDLVGIELQLVFDEALDLVIHQG